MEYTYITPLQGSLIVTDDFHSRDSLLRNRDFYKFIWVREGSIDIEIDHMGTPGKRPGYSLVQFTPHHLYQDRR